MHFASTPTPLNGRLGVIADPRVLWLIAEQLVLSPVLVVGDGGERRAEAVDVERHVALVAQQLHVGILLPAAHAAGAEAAFGVRVGFAVLTLRAGLPWNRSGLFTGQRFWDLMAPFTYV